MLECPHCQSCFTVEDWNKQPSIKDEPIPLDLEDWDEYIMDHDGRIDCPDCGEVAIFEDLTPV